MLNSSKSFDGKGFSILRVLQTCIAAVTECARLDNGGSPSTSVNQVGADSILETRS